MKKGLLTLLISLTAITLVTGCGCGKKKDNSDTDKKQEPVVNTEENVIKDQELEVFKFTNTALIYDNSMSTLTTEVLNDSDSTAFIKSFNIIVKDKEGKEMITLLGYIGEEVPSQETRTITSSTDLDLTKAASIEYTINK